ncbi:protein of unknown function (plasmid) [Shinella sp. WSC3-e]|nr:protein of unknown function [Shinella sp. WSC3-e]
MRKPEAGIEPASGFSGAGRGKVGGVARDAGGLGFAAMAALTTPPIFKSYDSTRVRGGFGR